MLVTFYARTDMYVSIIHNKKKKNSFCMVTVGPTKVNEENMRLTKKKALYLTGHLI